MAKPSNLAPRGQLSEPVGAGRTAKSVPATFCAIDIGGTGSRVLLVDGEGRHRVAEFERPTTAESALTTVERTVIETKKLFALPEIRKVRAGVTGFNGVVPDIDGLGERLAHEVRLVDLIVADDSVSWALGALGGESGVVVAMGTGLVALGVGAEGQLAHVDGSGPHLGDRGSGWWAGRQGLIAAIAFAEQRTGGSAMLLEMARSRFGDLTVLPEQLRNDPNPAATIATFAVDVVRAAEAHDAEARLILHAIGRNTATAAAAAARRAGLPARYRLILVGGLSKAISLFSGPLLETLSGEGFEPELMEPVSDALSGALRLHVVGPNTDLVRHWARKEPSQ